MGQMHNALSAYGADHDGSLPLRVGTERSKVLIVDDEPDIVEEVIEQLEDEGLTCLSAFNAKNAMELIAADTDIGVVVTDVRMPGMDGLEMARQLKAAIDPGRDLSIIVVTGHAGMKEAVEALKLGAEDFLTKPISPEHLLHSVRRAGEMVQLRKSERGFQEQLKREVKAKTAELSVANQQLTDANQIKDQFLSVMGHELRTPLNAINGFAELLHAKFSHQDADAGEYLELIMQAGLRLSETVENILEFSETVSGSRKVNAQLQSLEDLLTNVLGQIRRQADKKGIALELSPLPQDQVVEVDSDIVIKALRCLVDNAIKFSPDGATVVIGAERYGGGVTLFVEDHGCGMRADEISLARQPLNQVNGTLTRSAEGTGMGLSLASLLSELHGGHLEIDSTPDVGTRVQIMLPTAQQP